MADGRSELFCLDGVGASPGRPALLGGRCGTCEAVFFPMQRYGCEKCGSEELAPKALIGQGQLICSARVHLSTNPGRPAPYIVGSIRLDDGATVRAILDTPSEAALSPGMVMVTTLIQDKDNLDLRFVPAVGTR